MRTAKIIAALDAALCATLAAVLAPELVPAVPVIFGAGLVAGLAMGTIVACWGVPLGAVGYPGVPRASPWQWCRDISPKFAKCTSPNAATISAVIIPTTSSAFH